MSATEMLALALIDALLRPLGDEDDEQRVLVAVAVARDVLATPYPEPRDHDCAWDDTEHYAALTLPWRQTVGRIHPDDPEVTR